MKSFVHLAPLVPVGEQAVVAQRGVG